MLTEDDLVAYLQAVWLVDPPGEITKNAFGNLSNKLLIKRKSSPSAWMASNVKQTDNVFELRLSHPDKDAVDDLETFLMAFPGAQPAVSIVDDFSSTLSQWHVVTPNASIVSGELKLDASGFNSPLVYAQFTNYITNNQGVVQVSLRVLKSNFMIEISNGYETISTIFCYDLEHDTNLYRNLVSVTSIASISLGETLVIKLCNFNFTTHKYDIYLNDVLVCNQVSMDYTTLSHEYIKIIRIEDGSNYGIGCDTRVDYVKCGIPPFVELDQLTYAPSLEVEYQDKDSLQNHVWRIRFSGVTLE